MDSKMKKIIAIVIVIIVIAAGVAAAVVLLNSSKKSDTMVINEGAGTTTVKVYTSPDFPPYEYVYSKGVYAGSEIDVLKALSKLLDIRFEINPMDFDGILGAIPSGDGDLGVSGFTITEEREKSALFTKPWCTDLKQVLLVKASNDVTTEAEAMAIKNVAGETATTGLDLAIDLYGKNNVRQFTDYPTLVEAVKTGECGGAVLDNLVAESYVKKNPELKIATYQLVSDPAEYEDYGFMLKLGNTELKTLLDKGIDYITNDSHNIVKDIISYYADNGIESKGYFDANPDKLAALPCLVSKERGTVTEGLLSVTASGSVVFTQSENTLGAEAPLSISEGSDVVFTEATLGPTGNVFDDIGNWFNSVISDIQEQLYNNFVVDDRYEFMVSGLIVTLEVTVIALFIGLLLGVVVATIRSTHEMNGKFPVLNAICRVYITIIRGTPMVIQLFIIYFLILAGKGLSLEIIASIAFGINSGAYVAEIIRAGINAVPKGQMEASYSLGMPFIPTMIFVILPQAIKNILPALCNEGISLLKETSIVGLIGLVDLSQAAKYIRGVTLEPFFPLMIAALIYLIIVMILTYLVKLLERRLNANAT